MACRASFVLFDEVDIFVFEYQAGKSRICNTTMILLILLCFCLNMCTFSRFFWYIHCYISLKFRRKVLPLYFLLLIIYYNYCHSSLHYVKLLYFCFYWICQNKPISKPFDFSGLRFDSLMHWIVKQSKKCRKRFTKSIQIQIYWNTQLIKLSLL